MSEELTVIETARKLGITLDALYRLIYAGRLPARKEGRRWMIPSDAVRARLESKEKSYGTARC
jgi:excisionase family DNA binding protein